MPRSHDKPKNQTRAQAKRTRESRLRGVHVKMAQELTGRVPSGPNWNKFDQQNGGALWTEYEGSSQAAIRGGDEESQKTALRGRPQLWQIFGSSRQEWSGQLYREIHRHCLNQVRSEPTSDKPCWQPEADVSVSFLGMTINITVYIEKDIQEILKSHKAHDQHSWQLSRSSQPRKISEKCHSPGEP